VSIVWGDWTFRPEAQKYYQQLYEDALAPMLKITFTGDTHGLLIRKLEEIVQVLASC